MVTVENCDFKHCITKDPSSKIVECESTYRTYWTNKQKCTTTIALRNCRGLENVNKEGELTEEIILKQDTTTGQPIGAQLDEAWVEVPGYKVD